MAKVVFCLILCSYLLVGSFVMIGQTEIVEKDQVNYWSFDKGKIKGKTIQDSFGTTDGVIQGKIASKKGKNGEALEFDGDKSNFVTFSGDVDFSKDFTWMRSEEHSVGCR